MGPTTTHKDADEIEVKLRLPDADAAARARDALLRGGPHARPCAVRATLAQENYFFDGQGGELGAQRCVLRLRFAASDASDAEETATLTLKGQQVLEGGIGVAREVEAALPDARAARRYVDAPRLLVEEVLLAEGRGGGAPEGGGGAAEVLRALEATEHGRAALARLRCLGGFKNVRREVPWSFFLPPSGAGGGGGGGGGDPPRTESALVELDETRYDWGTVYELEAEAAGAEAAARLRDALERALADAGVPFSRSTASKFRNFVRRTLE
jgi:uncharacterized protein YjbK